MWTKCCNINLLLLISVINLVHGYYLGCFKERSGAARLLHQEYVVLKDTLTPDVCIQHCRSKGYPYAGVQFANECFCSKFRPPFRYSVEEEDCDMKCPGDENKICGAADRMNVYETYDLQKNPVEKNYIGCMDTSKKKILTGKSKTFGNLTPEMCVAFCYRSGYRFSAAQNRECYCGNSLTENNIVNDDECNIRCSGNNKYICGGQLRSSVYTTGIPGYSERGGLLGCYEDGPVRLLSGFVMKYPENNSPQLCFNVCLGSGFKYAGVQVGHECFCGNVRPDIKLRRAEEDCGVPCPAEPSMGCGGNWRILVYSTKGILEQINKKKGCKDVVLFEDDFANRIAPEKWKREIKMPWAPDYEFVVLNNKAENVYVNDGKMIIKPILLDEDFVQHGRITLQGCTGAPYTEECDRQAAGSQILPPIESGKVTTKDTFSFKYGKIVIRAKLPKGDWLVPEIWLEPKNNAYGPHLASGRIRIAMSRGNRDLVLDNRHIGSKQLECGVIMGINDNVRARTIIKDNSDDWFNQFHNYTLTWTADNLHFSIDNEPGDYLISSGIPLSESMGFDRKTASRWKAGSPIAPFDQEFYISIGLSAGGMREFPDGATSGNTPKPWINKAVKGMLNFWLDRQRWHQSWRDEESSLQIDHVKVSKV